VPDVVMPSVGFISRDHATRLATARRQVDESVDDVVPLITDRIRRDQPALAQAVSDSMVALALRSGYIGIHSEPMTDIKLYYLLCWYYVIQPIDTDGGMLAEFSEHGLHWLARQPVVQSAIPGLPYTALMLAIYYYRKDVRAKFKIPDNALDSDFLFWYYLYGVHEYRLLRCVTAAELQTLNSPREISGRTLLSLLDIWMLAQRANVRTFDLGTENDQTAAFHFAQAERQSDPVMRLLRAVDAPEGPRRKSLLVPWFTRDTPADPRRQCVVGWCEYFGRTMTGQRLLVPDEWFDPELNYIWAKFPIASIAFFLENAAGNHDGDLAPMRAFGFTLQPYAGADTLGQTLKIWLNGLMLREVEIADWVGSEVIIPLENAGFFHACKLNLLQFITSAPMIPAEVIGNGDHRELGIALRRIWFC